MERRGYVALFATTEDPEVLRIIRGCLGGPPYRGPVGPPPDEGFIPKPR